MSMTGLQKVLDNIRPSFEYNVSFVKVYLQGYGIDMGCGNCPLLEPDCLLHVDAHPQPIAAEQVPPDRVVVMDAQKMNVLAGTLFGVRIKNDLDYVFSSHMVEDLPTREDMIQCLLNWANLVRSGGHLVILIPDMQGRRYPKVEEGGNPSHRIDVGREFFEGIAQEPAILEKLDLVQIDTIPHERSCTMDVVFRRK